MTMSSLGSVPSVDQEATGGDLMMIADMGRDPALGEAARELESAIHDARVAFDCIGLGETERAHTSAVTARVAIDAAITAVAAVLNPAGGHHAPGPTAPDTDLRTDVFPDAGLAQAPPATDLRAGQ